MRAPRTGYLRYGKRALDVALAAVALFLALPMLLLIASVSALVLREAPWFVQSRPGLNGKLFRCLKLKTLRTLIGADGSLLPDASRLTWWGSLLRRGSVDELPQLWNVLRGEMSLVGPRPLLPEYSAHYSERQRQRERVRPGLTGPAQLAGRNSLSWPDQLELDALYSERVSLLLDLALLLRTPLYLLRGLVFGTGIRAKEHATRPSFLESAKRANANSTSSLAL
jgi:lipopolysaccharide/colanic/teichoic acid biosynthesis glycosyltransferase